MQKKSLKISRAALFILLLILVAGQACVSKRLAKQAQKQEDAGLYEMAADNYLRSLNANKKNIDAATGLRRTAQITLNSRIEMVTQAYLSGDDRETVQRYLEAVSYQEKIRNAGITLSIPQQALTYYEEARPRFLEGMFEEARLLLEEESFSQAESILSEIARIDPSYRDISQYMRISRSEPLYRQGIEQYNTGFYRKAYNTFNNLLSEHGAYKDASVLREDALKKGMITIAIADFANTTRERNVHGLLKTKIVTEITSLKNPFLKVIDERNLNVFLREQELAASIGSEMKIGRLLSARAYLTGELATFDLSEGRMQRTERRAYLKEVVSGEDKKTGEKTSETLYHKVTYHEYRRESSASGSFLYQLSSIETGAVMISGVVELNPRDQIHYATFEGDPENLVPGHWEYRSKNSPKDRILDNRNETKRFQSLFSARQSLKSAEDLRTELINGLAAQVVRELDSYNPEK